VLLQTKEINFQNILNQNTKFGQNFEQEKKRIYRNYKIKEI